MAVETIVWDASEHLDSDAAVAAYLDAAFRDSDPVLIRAAIADVARARGMTDTARQAGVTRAALYKALGEGGNPSFETIRAVVGALGVRLAVTA